MRILPLSFLIAMAVALPVAAQIKAQPRPNAQPPWGKGITAISPESYYAAIECGKQGGDDPPCVFWDTGLCKNDDFALAMYTPYKQVAYEVWLAVRKKQPAPQPNYQAAQRQRVTIGITPVKGSTNGLTNLVLRRGGKPVTPVDGSVASARWTFDSCVRADRQRDPGDGGESSHGFLHHRPGHARQFSMTT